MNKKKLYNIMDLLDGEINVELGKNNNTYKLNGIVIPIMQRDYAQGRATSYHIRNRFLDNIFDSLENNKPLELDFIYGSVKEIIEGENKTKVFIPLDGQQRLTTLYLLQWYISNKELNGTILDEERDKLLKFTYATRSTARQFCNKLVTIGFKDNVKASITSSYWFHQNYTNDPTVMGMLTTIDDIEKKYSLSSKNLFKNLKNISFYMLLLDGFDLTDELYIKMNSRGKELTDFENFKADIINWMKSNKNPEQKDFDKKVKLGNSNVPLYLSIASKFDNSWTDFFWDKAKTNLEEKNKIVDPYFFRFLKRFFLNDFISKSVKTAKEIELSNEFKLLYSTENEKELKYKSFDNYKKFVTIDTLSALEKILDSLAQNQTEINEIIKSPWNEEDDTWFLSDSKITQMQRILFFAVTTYLEKNDFEKDKFAQWIRVTWNIIIDPDIRTISNMIMTIKTVNGISIGSKDIYNAFRNGQLDDIIESKNNILKNQLIEEKKKIKLFQIEGWKDSILKAEKHQLLQGNIGFLFGDDDNLEAFDSRLNRVSILFSENGSNSKYYKNHELFRYCISKLKDWNEIESFNFADDYRNWQLCLRRNQTIRKTIFHLCSISEIKMKQEIQMALNTPSQISSNWEQERRQLVHSNLYLCETFFNWAQTNNLSKIRWRNDLYYFVRPNAWYDKVLIDGYRNVVINSFCQSKGIDNSDRRCGESNFFWGEDIEYLFNNKTQKIIFKGNNEIEILRINDLSEWELIPSQGKYKIEATNKTEAESFAKKL